MDIINFSAAEHELWLQQRTTQIMIGKLNHLRLSRLESAAMLSQQSGATESILRQKLNEAAAIKEVINFLTTPVKQ
jgi:hypothetical protein